MGGYAGGPEGTAVVTTAYCFHGILVARATYHLTYPVHITHVASTTPEMLYVVSTSGQAVSRNVGVPYYALGYAAAGSATKQYFYEAAAYLLAIQSSGMGIEDVHPNKAVVTNGALPIDSEPGSPGKRPIKSSRGLWKAISMESRAHPWAGL